MDAGGLTDPHPTPVCGKGTGYLCGTPPAPKYPPHPMWRPEWWRMASAGAIRAGLCLWVAGVLCCAGGIGGGGIYVTVLMVFGDLTIHDAIPLSKVVVFAASAPSLVLNMLKSISKEELGEKSEGGDGNEAKSLIDWNLCRVVVPWALIGTLMGVFLNNLLPGKLVIGLLVLVLIGIMLMLCRTGYNQHCAEKQHELEEQENAKGDDDAPTPAVKEETLMPPAPKLPVVKEQRAGGGVREQLLAENSCLGGFSGCYPEKLIGKNNLANDMFDESTAAGDTTECETDTETSFAGPPGKPGAPGKPQDGEGEKASDDAPMHKKVNIDGSSCGRAETALAVSMLVVIILCGTFHFWAEKCAAFDWVGDKPCHNPLAQIISFGQMVPLKQAGVLPGMAVGAMIIAILYCAVLGCLCVYRIMSTNQVYGSFHNFDELGHDYNRSIMAMYITMSLVTGSLAGLVGIGGGLIFSPVFIMMKVDTHIAVATSATCVIFTSSSTTFQYLFSDRIIVGLIISFCVPHLFAAYTGTKLVHYIQDNYGSKKSWITWIVAAGVGISMCLAMMKFFSHHAVAE